MVDRESLSSSALNIRTANTVKLKNDCFSLRRQIFIAEQNVPETLERDDDDQHATHVLAELGDRPVGAGRYIYVADYAKLQRICVLSDLRGHGVGVKLVQFMVDDIRNKGQVARIRLASQMQAISFYERMGFVAEGDVFLDAGIEHKDMELSL